MKLIYKSLLNTVEKKGAAFLILIDPDKVNEKLYPKFIKQCEQSGVDGFLIGGSLMTNGDLNKSIKLLKENSTLPVIIFPGSVHQVDGDADAILFLSLISGRNAEHLIGSQVIAAPMIKKVDIEPISTGYMLVESGRQTTAEYISGSKPIPRNKPEIAAATALAGEYLGMKFIYLESGSGAELSVPEEMISAVSNIISTPIIVGGGIKDPATAKRKVQAGASIVITGNHFEDESNWNLISKFAEAVHTKE